jgi:hypothetical protein
MKKTILNLGAILLAFVIGVSINNACAGSIDNMNDSELRKLVAELQQEVNNLKDRVAELERKNRNSSSNDSRNNNDIGGEFIVDGMHFGRDGNCTDPIDYYGGSNSDGYQIIDGVRIALEPSDVRYKFSYDSFGRIASFEYDLGTISAITTYTYSEKKISRYTVTKYNYNGDGTGLTEQGSTSDYYYK